MQDALNVYQDRRIETKGNFGVDIALQRADDLDQSAIQFLSQRSNPRALDAASASGGQAIRMPIDSSFYAWIDPVNGWLVVDVASASKAAASGWVFNMSSLKSVGGARFYVLGRDSFTHFMVALPASKSGFLFRFLREAKGAAVRKTPRFLRYGRLI